MSERSDEPIAGMETTSVWLPTAILESDQSVDSTKEKAFALLRAHHLAAQEHMDLQFKLILAGSALLVLSLVSLGLSFVLLDLIVGISGFVLLLLLGAGALVYGTWIHKPLAVSSIRKTWWTAYLLPYRSEFLLFDADAVAPKNHIVYGDIPARKIRDIVEDMPGQVPDSLDVERAFREELASIQEMCEQREQVDFETAVQDSDSPFVGAALSIVNRCEPGGPSESTSRALTLSNAIEQRDHIHALESSRYIIELLQESKDIIEEKTAPFITNLENSTGRVEQYIAYVRHKLMDRWFGEAQILGESTTLTTIMADRKQDASAVAAFDYEVSPMRVSGRDSLGHTSVLSVLDPIIVNFEDRIEAGVLKVVQNSARIIHDRERQAENNIRVVEDSYTRSIRSIEQAIERDERQAESRRRDYDSVVSRANQAVDRANAEARREQPNRAVHDNAVSEANRLQGEADAIQRGYEDLLENIREQQSELANQRQEMSERIQEIRGQLREDIAQSKDSAREEIQRDREHLDRLYELRDGQLSILINFQKNVLDEELDLQSKPFIVRREDIHDVQMEITAGLMNRRDEQQAVVDQIEGLKVLAEIPQVPTTIHIPFWVVFLESSKGHDTITIPPQSVERPVEPPKKSGRKYVSISRDLSTSLSQIAGPIGQGGGTIQEALNLPLTGPEAAAVSDALDALVFDQMLSPGYSKRIKKFFELPIAS